LLKENLIGRATSTFLKADSLEIEIVDGDVSGEFINQLIPAPAGVDIYQKIPSKRQVDKWWNQFGILAYGASSNQDKNDYFFGFAEDFWVKNESVTIGFGVQGRLVPVTITFDGVNLICSELEFRGQHGGVAIFDQWATGGEKQHQFKISVGAYFDNPYGAGAMQLWLMSIQPRAQAPTAPEAEVEAAPAMAEIEIVEPIAAIAPIIGPVVADDAVEEAVEDAIEAVTDEVVEDEAAEAIDEVVEEDVVEAIDEVVEEDVVEAVEDIIDDEDVAVIPEEVVEVIADEEE